METNQCLSGITNREIELTPATNIIPVANWNGFLENPNNAGYLYGSSGNMLNWMQNLLNNTAQNVRRFELYNSANPTGERVLVNSIRFANLTDRVFDISGMTFSVYGASNGKFARTTYYGLLFVSQDEVQVSTSFDKYVEVLNK